MLNANSTCKRYLNSHISLLISCLIWLFCVVPAAFAEQHLPFITDLSSITEKPIGRISSFTIEKTQTLSLEQALTQYQQGSFTPAQAAVLTFGIGAPPVWLGLSIENTQSQTQPREFSIDTTWLDHVDIYIKNRQSGHWLSYSLGDSKPFTDRPHDSRDFQVDIPFAPGITDIMVHVQTADSMVLPIYLLSKQQQSEHEQFTQYSYGLIYGYLLALLLYNCMLFIGLHDVRYLLYSALLASFMAGNIAYTGHGFMWFWPDSTAFQLWCQPLVMILFGSIGLLFALYFLEIKVKSIRIYHSILALITAVNLAYLITLFADLPTLATIISFVYTSSYMLITTVLGIYSMIKKQHNAQYYLIAITFGSAGVAVAALASWGILPYNEWLFRAAELGMLAEATLLAQTLSNQFRTVKEQNILIERLADTDLLTELNNRRGFFKLCGPIWNNSLRHRRHSSLIIFDLDNFKKLNDMHGHDCGDQILKKIGKLIQKQVRKGDVAARWGGEEFVILLAETNLVDTLLLAERLRLDIATTEVKHQQKNIGFTASFGVAQQELHHISVESLIAEADAALYHSKTSGKNRISTMNDLQKSASLLQTANK